MAQMTAAEAIKAGVYGFYLADRARQLRTELDELMSSNQLGVDSLALARWAGRASVTLSLIAEEFAGPLPDPTKCAVCGNLAVLICHADGRNEFRPACDHA